jgi:hypothetical protein
MSLSNVREILSGEVKVCHAGACRHPGLVQNRLDSGFRRNDGRFELKYARGRTDLRGLLPYTMCALNDF